MENKEGKEQMQEYIGKNGETRKVQVDSIQGSDHSITIEWSGTAGFGEYYLAMLKDGKIGADSEWMDRNEDKGFLHLLLADIESRANIQV
jgi:hypothetical protein